MSANVNENETPAVSVQGLSKVFKRYAKARDLALEVLTGTRRHREFRALDDITFTVPKGEVLGIVGSNGAGKSTLLKILTGVLDSTSGTVKMSGRVTAILELGIGFNPEYTGRENLYLGGLMQGMSRQDIDARFDDIVEFSGLKDFIDEPFRTYSSGMQARLMFSLATAVDPEILIVDEALATGDAMFTQKSLNRMRELCRRGQSELLVSHSTGTLAQLCHRVMWLDQGRVRMIGAPLQVIQAYDLHAHLVARGEGRIEEVPVLAPPGTKAPMPGDATSSTRAIYKRGPVSIERVQLLDSTGRETASFQSLRSMTVRVHYRCEGVPPHETLGIALALNRRSDLLCVSQAYSQNRFPDESETSYATASFRQRPSVAGFIEATIDPLSLQSGNYILSIGLLPNVPGSWEFYEYHHFGYDLVVTDGGMAIGALTFGNVRFRHGEAAPPAFPEPVASAPVLPPLGRPPRTIEEEIRVVCFDEGKYPQGWPIHAACPACGERRMHETFRKYGLAHSVCESCALVFLNPYPTEAILDRAYNAGYYPAMRRFVELPRAQAGDDGPLFSHPREVLERVIETLARPERGDWLEVGGGMGHFANLIQKRLPHWKVWLNERNLESRKIASDLYGLEVVSDSAEELEKAGRTFDVISLVAVLEHIPDPYPVLQTYTRLLRKGGHLVLAVPRFSPLNRAISKDAPATVIPPYHVTHFDERNLEKLLTRIGGFDRVDSWQDGPSAFCLVDFIKSWPYWEVLIPQEPMPAPVVVKHLPYPERVNRWINAFGLADQKARDFFVEIDGALFLTVLARRG